MKLGSFLEALSLGELGNLWIGHEGLTGFSEANRRRMLVTIGQGLRALSSRFCLLQREVLLVTVDGRTTYHLRREYAQSNPTVGPSKYLDDSTAEPFVGDLVKILRVYNEQGCEMPLNDEGNCNSLFTPAYDTILIPSALATGTYSIIYQANHPMMLTDHDAQTEFELPPLLEEALTSFVAWKVYSFMGGGGGAPDAKAAEHKARYDELCTEFEFKDLGNTSAVPENTKLQVNGWV